MPPFEAVPEIEGAKDNETYHLTPKGFAAEREKKENIGEMSRTKIAGKKLDPARRITKDPPFAIENSLEQETTSSAYGSYYASFK